MKAENIFDAISRADEEIIERALSPNVTKKKTAVPRIVLIASAAACVCFIAVFGVVSLLKGSGTHRIPTYEGAAFSADRIAEMAGMDRSGLTDGGTKSYTKIYVPDEESLNVSPLPTDENITVYDFEEKKGKRSKDTLFAFSDALYPGICSALGVDAGTLEYFEHTGREERFNYLGRRARHEKYYVTFFLSSICQRTLITSDIEGNPDRVISLNGEAISVDQRMTDVDMAASLQGVRKTLCELFGADLPDTAITRTYDGYSEYGATWICVYFYNGKDTPDGKLPEGDKLFDYICLDFDNFKNYSDDIVSSDVVSTVFIEYYHYLSDCVEPCANVRLLPLKEAEELLYGGYVFGMHACPLCMAAQPEVDFHGYDFVDLRYVNGVPFYVFFKKLNDTASNGNIVFARTNVPAIEVSGLEEYFESQIGDHPGY